MSSFGTPGTGDGQFSRPAGVAINQTSGEVYVTDPSNIRVERFAADGSYISQFGSLGSGDGQFGSAYSAASIAVDDSSTPTAGSVYVTDPASSRVEEFKADGTFLRTLGASGPGQLSYPAFIAVSPLNGSVYVADTGKLVEFDSSGNFVAQLDGSDSPTGPFGSFGPIAIDSQGRVWVTDFPGTEAGGFLRVQRFSAIGEFETALSPEGLPSPQAAAVDPSDDNLLLQVAQGQEFVLREFDPTGADLAVQGVGAGLSAGGGFAVSATSGAIYAADPINSRVDVFSVVTPPLATIAPPTSILPFGATFNGAVNPAGNPTGYHFEYSNDGGASWTPFPEAGDASVGSGVSVEPVTQTTPDAGSPSGLLLANTSYLVRLVAKKTLSLESSVSPEAAFSTPSAPPLILPSQAPEATAGGARLLGRLRADGPQTTYQFEYGPDQGYGAIAPTPAGDAGESGSPVDVSVALASLQADTTYHFRLVASNAQGTVFGPDRTFTTAEANPFVGLPDGRVWERVSPAEKNGASIHPGNITTSNTTVHHLAQAAQSGNAIAYASAGNFGGDGGPAFTQYIARRGPDGWSSVGINPPLDPFETSDFYAWFSPELDKGIVYTTAALNPGDPERIGNLYLRDTFNDSYETLTDADETTPKPTRFDFSGASADAQRVYYAAFSEAGTVKPEALFESHEGQVRKAGLLPNGEQDPANLGNGEMGTVGGHAPGGNPVSSDGRRIFFKDEGSYPELGALYEEEEGSRSVLVSSSERTGDDAAIPHLAEFWLASKDGSVGVFSSTEILTDDATALNGSRQAADLYRWNLDQPLGSRLTDLTTADPTGADVLGTAGASDDATSIYFVAQGKLTHEATRGRPNLYFWREGHGVQLVAELDDALIAGGQSYRDADIWTRSLQGQANGNEDSRRTMGGARVSPDGRYIAFTSYRRLTSYDTSGTRQIYLYDSRQEQLTCISCGTVNDSSRASSWLQSSLFEDFSTDAQPRLPRNLSPDGSRVFFDSKDALVPRDTNGATDVYEWSSGHLHLLSGGTNAQPSRFMDAGEDGKDVFFTTAQQLVRSDQDSLVDLYDARVGGVSAPAPRVPCIADECQGTPLAPPTFTTPGTATTTGSGQATQPGKARCSKGKHLKGGKCMKKKQKRAKHQQRGARR